MLTEVNNNEATHAEEPMHGVQSPFNYLLEVWCDQPNDEIEEPVRRGRQGHTLRSDSQRHDLWWVEPWNGSPAIRIIS
jgi:hypothetical protein